VNLEGAGPWTGGITGGRIRIPRRHPELPDWDGLVKIQYVDIIGRWGNIIGTPSPSLKEEIVIIINQ
jgi:hypothetical protein